MSRPIRVPANRVHFASAEWLDELGLSPLGACAEAPPEMARPAPADTYQVSRALGERLGVSLDFRDLDAVAGALREDRPSLAAGLVMGLRQALDAAEAVV